MRKTTGLSLLLLIFLSLCLMTFALLSFSGAKADDTLSQKSADRTAEYYAADSEANRILAQIDGALAVCLRNTGEDAAAFLRAASLLSEQLPEINWISEASAASDSPDIFQTAEPADPSAVFLSFTVPITESQELFVSVKIQYPYEPEDTMYQILSWKVQNTSEWTPDRTQNLYQSN